MLQKLQEKAAIKSFNTLIHNIIYVSSDSETLARDLNYLSSYYEVKYIQPVDMFPMTCHVETVVSLSRKK